MDLDIPAKQTYCLRVRQFIPNVSQLSLLSIVSLLVAILFSNLSYFESRPYHISPSEFEAGSSHCSRINDLNNPIAPELERKHNPRFIIPSDHRINRSFILTHANLIDGDGKNYLDYQILVHDGLIVAVEKSLKISDPKAFTIFNRDDHVVIDVEGHYVTPGLVDMHSHMGVGAWPELVASEDTNEETSPITPYLRAIDAISPHDPAIQVINAGVTTSLVLPGSGNLIGGEGIPLKHRKPSTNLVSDMLLFAQSNKSQEFIHRHIKMACGENPKNTYGERNVMPSSRMGEGFLFREQFNLAKELKQKQDNWCDLKNKMNGTYGRRAIELITKPFPEDIKLELLVGLLRGEVLLQNHCYETYDIEAMIRHSKEFGFKVTAFHHALEAWQIADTLASENISAAIFADHWGFKKEAYGTSVHAAEILTKAGVKVAFKSDHPVLNSQHLIYQAQKAFHYGLDEASAIKSVTSIPAENIGAQHRVGYIRQGYDADIVVWNKHPLQLGATPLKVFVDGYQTYTHPAAFKLLKEKQPIKQRKVRPRKPLDCDTITGQNLYLMNISRIYVNESLVLDDLNNLSIRVLNGQIACIGDSTTCTSDSYSETLDLRGGVVMPGLVLGSTYLGLQEITAEDVTNNGQSTGFEASTEGPRAVDGLRLDIDGSRLMQAAYNSGISVSIPSPKGSGIIHGQTCSFRLGLSNHDDAIIEDVTGLTIAIGQNAKENGLLNSVAGQIMTLRKIFKDSVLRVYGKEKIKIDSILNDDSPFDRVVTGEITLQVKTDQVDNIARVISLKKEIQNNLQALNATNTQIKVTIIGGAESFKLASQLSEAHISVFLKPGRCTPGTYETRNCLLPNGIGSGMSFINESKPSVYFPTAHILYRAGVSVGLGVFSDDDNSGLLWEAAWVYQDCLQSSRILDEAPLSPQEAIGMVTWEVAKMFGVRNPDVGRIHISSHASLLVYNADPIDGMYGLGGLHTHLKLVVNGNKVICNPSRF